MDLLDILSMIGFGLSVNQLVSLTREYHQARNQRIQLQSTPPISLAELQTISKNKTIKGRFLVKTSCSQSFKIHNSIDVGSNQVFFNLLPLARYLQNIRNSAFRIRPHSKRKDPKHQLFWTAEKKLILEVPVILNTNLLEYDIQYQSIFSSEQKPGFFGTIFKYVKAVLAAAAEFILQLFSTDDVLINGPKWGTLTIGASLITNVPLILCCDLERGTVVPRYLGLTKSDVLDYLNSEAKERKLLVYSAIVLAIAVVLFNGCIKAILEAAREQLKLFFKTRRMKVQAKRYNPETKEDDNLCIICYVNCKNIVFKRCKHMILCHQCANDRKNRPKDCPYCRTEVDIQDYLALMELEE